MEGEKPGWTRRHFLFGAAALAAGAVVWKYDIRKRGAKEMLQMIFGKQTHPAELKGKKILQDNKDERHYLLVLDIKGKGNNYYEVDKESFDLFADSEQARVEFTVNADGTLNVKRK